MSLMLQSLLLILISMANYRCIGFRCSCLKKVAELEEDAEASNIGHPPSIP